MRCPITSDKGDWCNLESGHLGPCAWDTLADTVAALEEVWLLSPSARALVTELLSTMTDRRMPGGSAMATARCIGLLRRAYHMGAEAGILIGRTTDDKDAS